MTRVLWSLSQFALCIFLGACSTRVWFSLQRQGRIGKQGHEAHKPSLPGAVTPGRRLVLTAIIEDTWGAVYDIDANALVLRFGPSGSGPGHFTFPRGCAAVGDQCVAFCDTFNSRIKVHRCDSGTFVKEFSTKAGLIPVAGMSCTRVGERHLVVCLRYVTLNRATKIYDYATGRIIRKLCDMGHGCAALPKEMIAVTGDSQLTIFRLDGSVVRHIADSSMLRSPRGCSATDGLLAVCDVALHAVIIFEIPSFQRLRQIQLSPGVFNSVQEEPYGSCAFLPGGLIAIALNAPSRCVQIFDAATGLATSRTIQIPGEGVVFRLSALDKLF